MDLRVLALGSRTTNQWISNALFIKGGTLDCFSSLPDTPSAIRESKYNLAVVDSYIADMESLCFKLIWYYRLRVAIITSKIERDWSEFKLLGVDGFISSNTGSAELVADLEAIAKKGSPVFPKLRVLVIEDDTNIREAVRLCFHMFWPEIELLAARDGKSGLALIQSDHPDMILLDLGLPDISGYEVMTQVRSNSQTPILVLTATLEKEYVIKAIQKGANDYIIKPFKQIDLMTRIKKHALPVLEKNSYSAFRFFF
jgi:CheY-like chemotaxis protein